MSIVCYVVHGGNEIDRGGWERARRELGRSGFVVDVVANGQSLDLVGACGRLLVNLETRDSNGALDASCWPSAADELAARPHSIFIQAVGDGDGVLDLFATCARVLAVQLDGLVYDECSGTLTRADGSDASAPRIVAPREGIAASEIGIGTALLAWTCELSPEAVEQTVREAAPAMRLVRIGKVDHLDAAFARERTRRGWRYIDLGDVHETKLALELERRAHEIEIRIVVDDDAAPHEPAIALARRVLERLATAHGARLVGFEPD